MITYNHLTFCFSSSASTSSFIVGCRTSRHCLSTHRYKHINHCLRILLRELRVLQGSRTHRIIIFILIALQYFIIHILHFIVNTCNTSISPHLTSLSQYANIGTLVAKWQPDYAENLIGATNTAAQASLCAGIVRYVTHVVHTHAVHLLYILFRYVCFIPCILYVSIWLFNSTITLHCFLFIHTTLYHLTILYCLTFIQSVISSITYLFFT